MQTQRINRGNDKRSGMLVVQKEAWHERMVDDSKRFCLYRMIFQSSVAAQLRLVINGVVMMGTIFDFKGIVVSKIENQRKDCMRYSYAMMQWVCWMVVGLGLSGIMSCVPSVDSLIGGQTLPKEWREAGHFPQGNPEKDLSSWWDRFGDPDLSKLIRMAMSDNLNLKSAVARIEEARGRRGAEIAGFLPSFTSTVTRREGSNHTEGLGTASGVFYAGTLGANWELDVFGRRRNSFRAASANLGAASENLNSVKASLSAEIATVYTVLRANQARIDVLKSNVKAREQTAQLAVWRQESGASDVLESSQSLSSLESARAAMPSLEQAISQGLNQLSVLLGHQPGSLEWLRYRSPGVPLPAVQLALGIPADTLRQRPDVRQAGYQVLAAAANTKVAEAARYPSLSLNGSLGLNTVRAQSFLSPETTTANLLAGITAPIFDSGRIRSNIRVVSAVEQQAILNYRSVVISALADVENGLIGCRRLAEKINHLETAARYAREADEVARQRYQSGEIDFLGVLDAQRTVLTIEDALLSAKADRSIAYIRLYQALGGGWSNA